MKKIVDKLGGMPEIHDETLYLLTQTKVYGWQNELWEWYIYSRLTVNVGLTAIDFDRNNPAYQFKKE